MVRFGGSLVPADFARYHVWQATRIEGAAFELTLRGGFDVCQRPVLFGPRNYVLFRNVARRDLPARPAIPRVDRVSSNVPCVPDRHVRAFAEWARCRGRDRTIFIHAENLSGTDVATRGRPHTRARRAPGGLGGSASAFLPQTSARFSAGLKGTLPQLPQVVPQELPHAFQPFLVMGLSTRRPLDFECLSYSTISRQSFSSQEVSIERTKRSSAPNRPARTAAA
jgi:hypothetical protein